MPKRNNLLQRGVSLRFRRLLTSTPDGTPPWLEVVARGEGPGLFGPNDAPWVIHRDFATLVGGIRALLMQALHPGPLAGVRDHSRYAQDPLGRLAGTIRWLTVSTFACLHEVNREAGRVNRLHDSVSGEYQATEQISKYSARDEDLLLWVHVAFMESFLAAHQAYSWNEIPAGDFANGAENYVAQWSKVAPTLGLTSAPKSIAEVNSIIDHAFENGTLRCNQDTQEVVRFIENPPLPKMAMPIYRLFFKAAVATLRPELRELLKLKKPAKYVVPLTRLTLRGLRWAVGPENPIEDAALDRIARYELAKQS